MRDLILLSYFNGIYIHVNCTHMCCCMYVQGIIFGTLKHLCGVCIYIYCVKYDIFYNGSTLCFPLQCLSVLRKPKTLPYP